MGACVRSRRRLPCADPANFMADPLVRNRLAHADFRDSCFDVYAIGEGGGRSFVPPAGTLGDNGANKMKRFEG